jgi:hypothetical protein
MLPELARSSKAAERPLDVQNSGVLVSGRLALPASRVFMVFPTDCRFESQDKMNALERRTLRAIAEVAARILAQAVGELA